MLEAHILDSWTQHSERTSPVFGYLNVLGGFAAPLFLWLAGLSLVLSAERSLSRSGHRGAAGSLVMRRGFEIFLLAFAFRTQAFIVSPGNPLVSLLRVDILNIMGPSMVVAALLWRVARGARMAAVFCALAALALALTTPLVRTAPWVQRLAPVLQWYISPSGNHSTFTLFPWAGFVFAGAAFGALLATENARRESVALGRLGFAGMLLAIGSYYASTRPAIYETSSFWTTSPTYFGVRAGILMSSVWLLFLLTPLAVRLPRAFGTLTRLGRHSLFIYWVHVELVYGYATALIHHRLPLWLNAVAYIGFCAAMYWSIALKDRVLTWWRSRPPRATSAETVAT